jgi:chromosomal replication initiation ATPase DnaA
MALGRVMKIHFKPEVNRENVLGTERVMSQSPPLDDLKDQEVKKLYILNPKNAFANSIQGPGNQMAHAIYIIISNAPGKGDNPCFFRLCGS